MNNTTNNRYVVEQHINVFGKESINHITSATVFWAPALPFELQVQSE